MQDQASIGVPSAIPDAGASTAVDSPSTQGTESSSSDNVTTTPPLQEGATQQTTQEPDPLAGIPSIEEIQGDTVSKEAFVNLRGVYDKVKPQLDELTTKFQPFANVADRFSSPEEVQEIVDLKEKLFGWSRDDQNQLVPSTESAAQYLAEKYPQHADFLAADLLDMPTVDPDTGRTLPRIDLALEAMAEDPVRRAKALQILGGVEPSSIAPTWQPTAEELEVVKPELQDIYKGLPYEERESLKLNDPDFINRYLQKEKFQTDLMNENRVAQEREARQQQQRELYYQQQAENAGNQYVEQQFKTGFAEFADSIVERSKFIAPLDPQSEAARSMAPEQVTQMNQEIQRINTGVGKFIATVTAAFSHPDTAWLAADFLKEIGVDPKVMQEFDNARLEFARNARDYGELNFRASQQNGGNGNAQGLGSVQSNVARAMRDMKARGNLISQPLLQLMSKFFEMKAGNYNATLNGAPSVRPSVTGTAFDPTKAAPGGPIPQGPMTRAEIDRLYG